MIQISELTVRFGGVLAIDQLTVEMPEDIVGVIGPNGAGKTSLINVMSGFVSPASGTVHFNDTNLLTMPPHMRARWGLARSFQTVQIAEDLTVYEHILAGLDAHRHGRAEKHLAIKDSLEFVGLSGVASELCSNLNAYQNRLTELATCLAARPKLVLLDEPGGGLSVPETHNLRQIISTIKANFGAHTLIIDHDVELIRNVCASVLVLDFGKAIAFGPTEDVLSNPAVRAAYLGKDHTSV